MLGIKWAECDGMEQSLGIQAAMVAAAFVVFTMLLLMKGKEMTSVQDVDVEPNRSTK